MKSVKYTKQDLEIEQLRGQIKALKKEIVQGTVVIEDVIINKPVGIEVIWDGIIFPKGLLIKDGKSLYATGETTTKPNN